MTTSAFPQYCVVSQHPYSSAVPLCSPGNPITSTTPCVILPSGGLGSPSVAQFIVPRTVPLRSVTPMVSRPIYAIHPHSNTPCQNCGGPHPFSSCKQSTMLDAVNSGMLSQISEVEALILNRLSSLCKFVLDHEQDFFRELC